MRSIDNSEDVIDSRDIIERVDELEAGIAEDDATSEDADSTSPVYGEDEREELRTLKALVVEAEGESSDWVHGEALIRDSYFTEYAQQLAEDLGLTNDNSNQMGTRTNRWPFTHIDWDAAAEELQEDYSSVNFDNVIYWIRNS